MYIKEIVLYNFMPFKGEQKIELKDSIYCITAQYQENNERSNRAGKSSVVDAIEYCMFGTCSRSKKEVDLIHNDEKEMYVTIKFDDGFAIKRGRTTKNVGVLETPLTDSKDNSSRPLSQEVIDEYIGMSQLDFINTCYFQQGDIFGFLGATQGEKKKFITRWIEKEQWGIYENKCKVRVKRYEKELSENDIRINQLQNDIVDVEELNKNKKTYKQYFDNVTKVITTCESNIETTLKQLERMPQLSELNDKKNELVQQIIQITRQKIPASQNRLNILKENNTKRVACQAKCEGLKAKVFGLEDHCKTLEILTSSANKLQQEKAVIESDVVRIREEFKKFKGLQEGAKCPVCNSDITVEHKEVEIARITKEGKTKKHTLGELNTQVAGQLKQIEEFDRSQREFLSATDSLKSYETMIKNSVDNTEEIKSLNVELEANKNMYKELQKELDGVEISIGEFNNNKQAEFTTFIGENRDALKKAQEAKDDSIKNLALIDNQIENNKKVIAQLSEYDIKRDKAASLLERWRFLKYMFSQNGIVSYQIENSFRHIEDEINYLAEKLQMNSYIEFSALKQLSKWADKCVVCDEPFEKGERSHICNNCSAKREKATKDELNVVVYHAGIKEEFSQDSGGGRMLIAICFRIAIARMLRRSLNSKCEFLILDEIFGSLDSVNRNLVINLIMKFLQKEMGFKQIFMISHTPEFKNVGSDEIKVIRKNNYSEIAN